ncbi:MAG: hypothetical protein M1816_001260 [Peltula sp. TS41687]|nr:MAG: hypothetical protein M1816_001260 [Peltula sp. TS41687]
MHPIKLVIASSIWITPILSVPLPQDERPTPGDLLGQPPEEPYHRDYNPDLPLGIAGGFGISTLISTIRNRRFRSDTARRIQDMKRENVELRNRMPLDHTEAREVVWEGMDEFFADEKLVQCMRNNLGVEADWKPPLYISPDRWNTVGRICPGWKDAFRASPGTIRSIIPHKKVTAKQIKPSKGKGRPLQFSLETIPARMMDAVNRLASIGTKAAAAKKGTSWLPGIQGVPSFAPVSVL